MSGRFDYVKYDDDATIVQADFKTMFIAIEKYTDGHLLDSREKSLLMTKLEEAYMWAGKAIRNQQLLRNARIVPREGRNNG